MPTYIALLRAVNLGGATVVRMEALRALLEKSGFGDVRSWLQSGNLVFTSDRSASGPIETSLEAAIRDGLGLRTDVFVRTGSEWRAVVARNPFPNEARRDPSHLVVTALRSTPDEAAWERLAAAIRGPEIVRGAGRQAYLVYPEGIGRSRLTAAVIERELGVRGTSRNWNTVLKLEAIASGDAGS